MSHQYRTWIEIDTKAIDANIHTIKSSLAPGVLFCAVVKSNAYGHDFIEFAKSALNAGADMLAVDSVTEAFALREAGVASEILVLGYTLPVNFIRAVNDNIILTVSSLDHLNGIKDARVHSLRIHIKLDTGMHRQGFDQEALTCAVPVLQQLVTDGVIGIEGVYSHLASAKSREYSISVNNQKLRFDEMLKYLQGCGVPYGVAHIAASGGVLMYKDLQYDMVRVGIACYGLWPADEVRILRSSKFKLHPVLAWKAVISEVKTVACGERVGYDGTHILSRESKIAIIPIGYWHGYDRELGDVADVLIHGRRAPVIGRVSMDMIVVDVTDIEAVSHGDVAVLIGQDGNQYISPEELAAHTHTTAYEIVTRINPLIKRIYE